MIYARDTACMEDGRTIQLLSIGLVCEDGREFYAQNRHANYNGWPMYAHDLRSVLDMQGLAHMTQPDDMPHHALSDALWTRDMWLSLQPHM